MDSYATLKQSRDMDITLLQKPSYFQFKNNPLSSDSIIASGVAGITKPNPQPSIDKVKEVYPKGESPYEYMYQSSCCITLPKSPEYQATRQIIFAP